MADLLAATGGQGGARTIRRPYLLGGIVAAGFVTLLLIALLARVGAFVPLGFVLFVALMYVIVNLIVDLVYALVDPRIRLS